MVYYLYIINCTGTDYYKIGVSDRPTARLATLQTGCPLELNLLIKYSFKAKLEAYAAEAVAHRALKEHAIRGEWFELKYFRLIRWKSIVKGEMQQKEYNDLKRINAPQP